MTRRGRSESAIISSVGVLILACLFPVQRADMAAWACAPAPRDGEWVGIQQEQALIVWDSKSKTEHFIRQAQFDTTAKDFGFLVPTPSEPELGEVSDMIFWKLSSITAPKINIVKKRVPRPPPSREVPTGEAPLPDAPRVEVLQEKKVAGLDAAVLKADDPELLGKWLTGHGYAFRPELQSWLKAYTDQKWIITAFKLDGSQKPNRGLQAKSIRMSFKAERPFYPYREPEDMRDPTRTRGQPRMLRLFTLADQRLAGTLGKGEKAWQAKTVWSKKIAANPEVGKLLKLPTELADSNWHLTEFEDNASPRPGTDEVYFAPDMNQSEIERPPVTQEVYEYYDESQHAAAHDSAANHGGSPPPGRVNAIVIPLPPEFLWPAIGGGVLGLLVIWRFATGVPRNRQQDPK